MSWFDGSSSDTVAAPAPAAAAGAPSERKSERFLSSEREPKVSIDESDDLGGGIASADDRYNSMRQEIELAQRRLAVRERILTPDAAAGSGPDDGPRMVKTSEHASLAMRLQRRPQLDVPPPMPSMALWGTAALLDKQPNISTELPPVPGLTPAVPPVGKAINQSEKALNLGNSQSSDWDYAAKNAVVSSDQSSDLSQGRLGAEKAPKLAQEKTTREMLTFEPVNLAKSDADRSPLTSRIPLSERTAPATAAVSDFAKLGPFGMSEALRSPDSESSKILQQYNLYDKFNTTECHEHISWGPDGSVSVALKSADGYRRTIVCRADGSFAQRITDPSGKEMLRFSSSGHVVSNIDKRGTISA